MTKEQELRKELNLLRAAVRSYIDTVGYEEGVTFIDRIANNIHRAIIEKIDDEGRR